jgi:hypothetical protein
MRCVLSTILIAMILACHSLVATHAHLDVAPGHSSSHSGQPHFHWHGSHSHSSDDHREGHHHKGEAGSQGETGDGLPQCAGTTFYGMDSAASMCQRLCADEISCTLWIQLLPVNAGGFLTDRLMAPVAWLDAPPQWSSARIPLYLRDLAIRC